MRLSHGRQGTRDAVDGMLPGLRDPADPARVAKSPSNVVSPVAAAASMHDDLDEEARRLANGSQNVPIHPSQVPSEGSDGQETEGDGSVRDPTGIGRGT